MKKYEVLFVVLFTIGIPNLTNAQDTGYPPYGSFQVGDFDGINRQNLNVNFSIPIVSRPGRGLGLNFSLVYDSLIWQRAATALAPMANWGWKLDSLWGRTSYGLNERSVRCTEPGQPEFTPLRRWFAYVYTDASGTRHRFDVEMQYDDCYQETTGTFTGPATDGSGYYIDINSPTNPVVYSPGGLKITNARLTDTNGNYVSKVTVDANTTHYVDTLGKTALKIVKSPTSITYQVLDKNGGYQDTVLTLTSLPVSTNFGCSGVSVYGGTASVPSQISLPNGRSYTFTYEPNTARLLRITLPTGGYYEYVYPTSGTQGFNCTDGTYTEFMRNINDLSSTSSWDYDRTQIDASTWETKVTAPQLPYDAARNESVFRFVSGKEAQAKFYQGAAGGTLLRTVDTNYAANNTPSVKTVTVGGLVSKTETDFNTSGNLLAMREYEWGSGAPGAALRSTTITYRPPVLHMLNRVTQVLVRQGGSSGDVKSRTDIEYDGRTPDCVTGAVQHSASCSFNSRGNPTTITTYTNAAVPSGAIAKNIYYDTLGNVVRSDADCCRNLSSTFTATAAYAFAESIVRGATGGPQVSTAATYNLDAALTVSTSDENNRITTLDYDTLGRLVTVQRPDGQQITTSYDDALRIVTVDSPLQGATRLRAKAFHDGLGREIKRTQGNTSGTISIVETQYDPLGRVWKVSNPHNSTAQYWTETRYDASGRVAKQVAPDGAQTTYSYSNNTVLITDPGGHQRKHAFDGMGRLVKTVEPDPGNGNQLTLETTYIYTLRDELKQVTHGSQTRTYDYDHAARLTSEQSPESGTTQYQYNQWSLATQRTDARGVITTFSYDTLNRLSQVSYNVGSTGVPATPTVTYTYGTSTAQNNKGRLLTMTDGTGSETYQYDLLGRITNIAKVLDGVTYSVGYGYNLAGQVLATTYPSGRIAKQHFDNYGRLGGMTQQKDSVETVVSESRSYNAAGQVTYFRYGNGVNATFGISANRLQLASLTYDVPSQTYFSLGYGYVQTGQSNDGRIKRIEDYLQPGRSLTLTYDAPSRLSTAISDGSGSYSKWGLSWAYDRYGNRTAQTRTFGTQAPQTNLTYNAATNRITTSGFSYDANGNLTAEPGYTYQYDAENRPVSLNSGAWTYSYDGNSLRVKRTNGSTGARTGYIYDGANIIAEYLDGAGAQWPGAEWIYQDGRYLARVNSAGTTYYHNDHLSTRLVTNADASVAGERGHYPFGEAWYDVGTWTNRAFTNYVRDTESFTDQAVMRQYGNREGRFLQPDLIDGTPENPQSWNRYAYVTNSPMNYVDPLGLVCSAAVWTKRGAGYSMQPRKLWRWWRERTWRIWRLRSVGAWRDTSDRRRMAVWPCIFGLVSGNATRWCCQRDRIL